VDCEAELPLLCIAWWNRLRKITVVIISIHSYCFKVLYCACWWQFLKIYCNFQSMSSFFLKLYDKVHVCELQITAGWRVQRGGKRKFFTKPPSVMTRSFRHHWKSWAWILYPVLKRFVKFLVFTEAFAVSRLADHLSGKPGNIREFCSCQGNVRKLVFCQGIVRGISWKKSCQRKFFLMCKSMLVDRIMYY